MPIRIHDEDLREPGLGLTRGLDTERVCRRSILIVARRVQVIEHRVEVADPDRKMDIPRIERPVRSHGSIGALEEMQLAFAEREPGPAEIEWRAVDLVEQQHSRIELLRPLEIRDRQCDVVQREYLVLHVRSPRARV